MSQVPRVCATRTHKGTSPSIRRADSNLSRGALLPSDQEGAAALGIGLVAKEGLSNLVKAVKAAVPPILLWQKLSSGQEEFAE